MKHRWLPQVVVFAAVLWAGAQVKPQSHVSPANEEQAIREKRTSVAEAVKGGLFMARLNPCPSLGGLSPRLLRSTKNFLC
jgi:hypothetical protein